MFSVCRRTLETKASLQTRAKGTQPPLVSTTQLGAGRCSGPGAQSSERQGRRSSAPPPQPIAERGPGPPPHEVGGGAHPFPQSKEPFSPRPEPGTLSPHPELRRRRRGAEPEGEGGRASPTPLRLREGNLISLPARQAGGRPGRCLCCCCNIIESAPLGRALRRPSAPPPPAREGWGRGGASRRSRKGWGGKGKRAVRAGGGGCDHPPTSEAEAGQPSSESEGAGNRSDEAGRREERSGRPGRALGRQGAGVGDPGGCSPALQAVSPLRGEGEGSKTKKA